MKGRAMSARGRPSPSKARRRPKSYLMPSLRVSAVWEHDIHTRQRPEIRTSADLSAVLDACLPEDDRRERFVMAMIDVRCRLIGVHTVSIGCLTGTIVHPRLCSAEHKRAYVAVALMWRSRSKASGKQASPSTDAT